MNSSASDRPNAPGAAAGSNSASTSTASRNFESNNFGSSNFESNNAGIEAEAREHPRRGQQLKQLKAYLKLYGFDRDPFNDRGTSGLFFPGAGRKQTLDSLQHFLRYGNTPVFLTGVSGAGKTVLLEEMIRQLEADVDPVLVQARLMMSSGQIFSAIAGGCGLTGQAPSADGSEWVEKIVAIAQTAALNGRRLLICIDSVQDLTPEVIQSVFELVASANGDIGILWVGEPQAASVIEEAGERCQLLVNRIELPQFDQREITDYVIYRLESAGYVGELPFTELQLQALLHRSQGNLRSLHQSARNMLMAAMDGKPRSAGVFPVLHTAAIACLLLALVFIWQYNQGQLDSNTAAEPAGPIVLEGVNSEPATLGDGGKLNNTIAAVDSGSASATVSTLATQVSQEGVQQVTHQSPRSDSVKVEAAPSEGQTSELEDSAEQSSPSTGADKRVARPESIEPDAAPTEARSANSITESPAVAEQGRSAVAGPELSTVTQPIIRPAHQRLLAWPELGYALQVFGTHNARRAKSLVDEYFGQVDLLFYETRHNGKPWFVVVNGPYSGRQTAKSSIESLPENLRRLRPWPRNIASIQTDIRRFSAIVDGVNQD